MKVLLTGGTGFIGRHVAAALLAQRHEVRCIARKPETALELLRQGIDVVPADLADPVLLRAAVRDQDAVIHAAAHVGEWGTRRRFEDANVLGTRNLLEAAEAAQVRRFVHVSSVAVYGHQPCEDLAEGAEYRLTGDSYCDSKIAAEAAVWESHRAGRVVASAVRPVIVYGPWDWKFVPKVADALRKGSLPLVNGGQHRAPIVYIRDVVDLVLACLSREEASGEAFNCASPEPVTWKELLTELARLVGAKPPSFSVPFGLVYAAGSVMETLWQAVGASAPPLITRMGATLVGVPMTYDTSKAERLLGWRPRVGMAQGLAETVAWLQAQQNAAHTPAPPQS